MPRSKKDDPTRNDPTVASNIRRFRIAKKMTQTDLGDVLGVTFQQIQKYENGVNAIAPGRLRQVARVLGVTPADMFGPLPTIDGEPIEVMSPWAYRTLAALNKIRSRRVKTAVGDFIQELVEQTS